MRTTIARTNITLILDVLQWHLEQMSPENGFLGGPIVVNRTLDPRLLRQNQAQEYREKSARVTLKPADFKLLRGDRPGSRGTLGGVKRYLGRIELIATHTLAKPQDDAGITLDMIQEWFRVDLASCVYGLDSRGGSTFISKAATALSAMDPTWQVPSCINPLLTEVLHGPSLNHPNAIAVHRFEFQWDEHVRAFAQSNL